MKRKVMFISASMLISTAVIFVLFVLSEDLNHRNNSFVRLFPPHVILLSKSIKLKYNSYYIAGVASDQIYLANLTAPYVLVANSSLTDTMHFKINFDSVVTRKFSSIHVTVDSPHFYLMDGVSPSIFRGEVTDWNAHFTKSKAYFSQAVPISNTSFAIRSVSSRTHENVLGKQLLLDSSTVKFAHGILTKQVDGLFCTDGTLHYDKDIGNLVYVYFYRNQFIRMDTNLNIVFKGKTIICK